MCVQNWLSPVLDIVIWMETCIFTATQLLTDPEKTVCFFGAFRALNCVCVCAKKRSRFFHRKRDKNLIDSVPSLHMHAFHFPHSFHMSVSDIQLHALTFAGQTFLER